MMRCTHGTSGQNANDNVQMFVAMDEQPITLLFLRKLLFCFDAPFFFSGDVAK